MSLVCGRTPGRSIALLLLLLLPAAVTTAQAGETTEVFAPFVSRLRLSIRDPQIRVTWVDAEGLVADYRIYRSNAPITDESLLHADFVATVAAGEEAFIDTPPAPGAYFYAVLAESPAGTPYRGLIPGRNTSFREVSVENVATEAQRSARVEAIEAIVAVRNGDRVIEITAVSDREGRRLAFYRSTAPITGAWDLAHAALVREVDSGAPLLIDFPVPGVGYYYAAVDSELLLAGGAEIVPGTNATVDPVEIPLALVALPRSDGRPATAAVTDSPSEPAAAAATVEAPFEPSVDAVRGIPLPFLQLQSYLGTGRRLQDPRILIPERSPLSTQTERQVATLLDGIGARDATPATFSVLSDDRVPDVAGAEYTLRTIIDGPISRMAWEQALVQLENYFTLPLVPELAARAHFYRAQVYYFLGERQLAVLEFLLARDRHYVESEAWLDRVLADRGP